MAFIIKDRVKEGTTSTGTGAITLSGAAATFDTFQSYMTNGDTTYYAIVHTSSGVDEWEVGLGTWNTGNTLTRTTVLAGSNGTSAEDFSEGSKDVFMTYPAAHAALAGDDVDFANITVTGTVDGRDVATDGTKLDTVEQNADVTDAVNVAAAGALMRAGGTMTGNLVLNADPAAALGAATKQYVDTIASAGIHYHTPVRAEHPSNLNATYSNGSSGVGATLTNAGTNAALVIDSVSMVLNDRVLVANQTTQTQNGVYTVTTVGDGSTAWVLTRSTDTDTAAPSDPDAFGKGDAFFIKEGVTNAGHLDVLSTSGTIIFGTTNIIFSEVAETTVYSGGTGITLTGTTFAIGQDVGTTSNVTFNQVTAAIIGNVTGDVTGNVTGNAGTATKLATARTIQLSGDVTGSASFDGSANATITAVVQDDSHSHVISNVDGLQTALNGKVPTERTISAGSGLTGGGDLTANRTISHADTSSLASVNNYDGTVIQDVYVDTYGHLTGINSVNLDSRFVNIAGDTMTGDLTIANNQPVLSINDTNNGSGGGFIGHIAFNNTSGESFRIGDWAAVDETSSGGPDILRLRNSNGTRTVFEWGQAGTTAGSLYAYNQRVFADNYHPNADKWTTARTLSLSGDASGSVSWDGSGNATLSVAVANDSHTHDGRYYTETEADSRFVSVTDTPESGDWWNGGYVRVATGGVIEIGKYIDWHDSDTATSDYSARLTNTGAHLYASGRLYANSNQRVFADDYHPNADKWTTARTLSLSGDVTGSVSWDGSANATLSTTMQDVFKAGAEIPNSADLNSYRTTGYYPQNSNSQAVAGSNYPVSLAGILEVITDDTGNGNHTIQRYTRYNSNNDTFKRYYFDGAWSNWEQNFDGTYHPNADKWTTARTLSLSGDASGSVSWDGSADATLSVTVADDSHNHTWANIDGGSVNGWGGLRHSTTSGYIDFGPANTNWAHIYTDRPAFYFNTELYVNNMRVFNTGYHPNADKWTTARTLSLSGDATGSVSWDGSADATLSVAVANDSHSHSNYITSNANDNVTGHTEWQDNYEIRLGNGADFRMWHNGSNTYFRNYLHADGDFYWQGEGTGGTNHNLISMHNDVATPYVRLYYDSSVVLETVSGGVNIAGNTAWHAGNDGSGSGLDADLLDGLQLNSSNRNNQANRVVRTQGSGYTEFGWINTTSGNTTSTLTDIYVNTNDGYIRKATLAHVASQLPIDAGAKNDIFWENGQNVTSNYTITNGKNAMSAGPITINSGVTVTVGAGETWTVI